MNTTSQLLNTPLPGGGGVQATFAMFHTPPTVPAGVDEMTLHDAALAYAGAGFFVVPVQPGSKNPGSVVGGGWHEKSSRDPAQIDAWWSANPDYCIALHVGRSGAIAFDLDEPSLLGLPEEMAADLRTARVQRTRTDPAIDSGHYLFALDFGESFSNAAGQFAPFGEVRGLNGVVMAAPSPHVKAATHGARYSWGAGGELPALPGGLRRSLRAVVPGAPVAEPLTSQAHRDFLVAHTTNDRPGALDGVVSSFEAMVEGGQARHEALVQALPWAYREAVAGCYPAQDAHDRLRAAFHASFEGSETDVGGVAGRRAAPAPGEFNRTSTWAAGEALLADPADTLARLDRGDPAVAAVDEEAFWSARPVLADLRTYAQACVVSPWAMLGVVLVRALTVVPPRVVLPKIVGSYASLNTFVALVGPSGSGKGAAERAAADAVDTFATVHTANIGSGEGAIKQYAYRTKGSEPQIGVRSAVLFTSPEVDNLTAQGSRSGSTLLPTLRSAWSGEDIGFAYADATKAIYCKAHRYRLMFVVGVQPGRARALFDDADGGTPQRFVWLPTLDPDAPEFPPAEPARWALPEWPARPLPGGATSVGAVEGALLDLPVTPDELEVLAVPEHVASEIRARRRLVLLGEESGLDGHRAQARLKVAAGLMWLEGRTDKITDEDWDLAGVVMAVSDRTRAQVQKTLGAKAHQENVQRGRAEGVRAVAAEDVQAEAVEAKLRRAIDNVKKQLSSGEPLTRKVGRGALRLELRDLYDEAAARLVAGRYAQRVEGKQGSYSLVKLDDP